VSGFLFIATDANNLGLLFSAARDQTVEISLGGPRAAENK
jgi:hypothetical protein